MSTKEDYSELEKKRAIEKQEDDTRPVDECV
jgi:hypothetical protein